MKKLLFIALLLGAGVWGYLKWRDWKPDADAGRLANRPTTAVVETRDIKFSVTAAGDIGPAEQVSVRPEVNGRIEKLAVDIGDSVKAGDLLFTLDDRDLQIAKESQETEIERAKLQREQADRNYKRSQQLFAENLIAQELFEETKTLSELARNALERAQKELDLVNDRLRKTRIEAPFDCTVLTRPVSVGQAVSGSGGFNSGTEVLTIANLNEMVINAHINQADVTRLKSGQNVEVQVEAVPGLVVTGTVERIAPQATIRNNVKGFAARILLKDVDKRIRPGMTANIKIPVAAAENVVAVPLAAVFTEINPQTGRSERYVFVKTPQGHVRRPVQIGISDFFFAEVQDGLASGETVLLEQPKEELENAGSLIAKGQAGQGQGGPGSGSGPRPASPAQTRETPSGSQTPATRTPSNAPPQVRPRGNT